MFKESRLKIIYYVVTFYSVMELLKFAIYPPFLWLLTKLVDLNQYLFLDRQMYGETMFFEVNSGIEMFWNLSYVLVFLVLTYRIIVWMKKYLEMKENYENSQLIFVLFPSVTGLLLCLMIRSMMFSMEDNDIHSLFDSRPEMNLMVPCTSLLCIVMIIFTAKMLHKLIVESNQKIEISVYQERIREMEQHIGDIENLYAGIRGMKHDMKNYIADMEALMQEETGNPTAFRQYLDSLQASVEQLDMKYNTGNPVTDVIMQRYVQLAKNYDIAFQADTLFLSQAGMDSYNQLSSVSYQDYVNRFESEVSEVYEKEDHADAVKSDSFDQHVNRMAAAYDKMKNGIEEKYAKEDRKPEYYIAKSGKIEELTKEKELDMLNRAYESHSTHI